MGNIEEINIKNLTYYFFQDMINIIDFYPNLLKIDKKSYKNIDIYYTKNIIIRGSDYVKINSVNPFYVIVDKVHGNFEEKNGNKYLIIDSKDKKRSIDKIDKTLK